MTEQLSPGRVTLRLFDITGGPALRTWTIPAHLLDRAGTTYGVMVLPDDVKREGGWTRVMLATYPTGEPWHASWSNDLPGRRLPEHDEILDRIADLPTN